MSPSVPSSRARDVFLWFSSYSHPSRTRSESSLGYLKDEAPRKSDYLLRTEDLAPLSLRLPSPCRRRVPLQSHVLCRGRESLKGQTISFVEGRRPPEGQTTTSVGDETSLRVRVSRLGRGLNRNLSLRDSNLGRHT